MPHYKHTMVFNFITNAVTTVAGQPFSSFSQDVGGGTSRRIGGWTESVYAGSVDPAGFKQLCQLRAAMLPFGASITGFRIQQVDPVGGSSTYPGLFLGSSGLQSDVPQMALMLRIPAQSSPNVSRMRLAGLPDARVTQGEYNPSNAFTGAVLAYVRRLAGGGWMFRSRDLGATQGNVLAIDNAGVLTFQTANPGFVAQQRVRVLRTIDSDGNRFGGVFTVSSAGSTTMTLAHWDQGITTGGRVRLETTIYPNFSPEQSPIVRVVVRKIGRPSVSYRGRQSKRR